VKSLVITADGVVGDRTFLLFDAKTGETASPETSARWRSALMLTGRTRDSGAVEIGFPDGVWRTTDAPDLGGSLSAHFGFQVALGIKPGAQEERGSHPSLQAAFGTPSDWPEIAPRYVASPLHLLTTASIAALLARAGGRVVDARRFRPGIVVETDGGDDFIENGWIGRTIAIGDSVISATEGTKRCAMTMIAQPGLPEDPEILRGILRHNRRNLGIYADVATPGTISVGDGVVLGSTP
jgi:uncharacterized protein YcbX